MFDKTYSDYILEHEEYGGFDVKLVVEGECYFTHRLILCAASDFFKYLLRDLETEDEFLTVLLPGFGVTEVRQVLDLLYNKTKPVVPDHFVSRIFNIFEFRDVTDLNAKPVKEEGPQGGLKDARSKSSDDFFNSFFSSGDKDSSDYLESEDVRRRAKNFSRQQCQQLLEIVNDPRNKKLKEVIRARSSGLSDQKSSAWSEIRRKFIQVDGANSVFTVGNLKTKYKNLIQQNKNHQDGGHLKQESLEDLGSQAIYGNDDGLLDPLSEEQMSLLYPGGVGDLKKEAEAGEAGERRERRKNFTEAQAKLLMEIIHDPSNDYLKTTITEVTGPTKQSREDKESAWQQVHQIFLAADPLNSGFTVQQLRTKYKNTNYHRKMAEDTTDTKQLPTLPSTKKRKRSGGGGSSGLNTSGGGEEMLDKARMEELRSALPDFFDENIEDDPEEDEDGGPTRNDGRRSKNFTEQQTGLLLAIIKTARAGHIRTLIKLKSATSQVRTAKERAWREIRKFFVASDPTNSNVSVSQLKVKYKNLACSKSPEEMNDEADRYLQELNRSTAASHNPILDYSGSGQDFGPGMFGGGRDSTDYNNMYKQETIEDAGPKVLKDNYDAYRITKPAAQPRTFACTECQYIGQNAKHLKNHRMRRHGGEILPCPEPGCHFKFRHKYYVTSHVKTYHQGKMYVCDQCPYTTKFQVCFRIHHEKVHEGVKYICDQCGFDGANPKALDNHIKVVHEGYQYRCKQCDYVGSSYRLLWNHRNEEHKVLRKIYCDECNYTTNFQHKLNQHKKRVHCDARFHCSICDFSAKTGFSLRRHQTSKHGDELGSVIKI